MNIKTRKFKRYKDFNLCCMDLGLRIGTDDIEKHQILHAYAKGPKGTVNIGFWDKTKSEGELHEHRVEIANTGLQPGHTCKVVHWDGEGTEFERQYYIEKTLSSNRFVDVPVMRCKEAFHNKSENCFECRDLIIKVKIRFRQQDVDPV